MDGTLKLPDFLITNSINQTDEILGKHKFLIKLNHYGIPRLEERLDKVFAGKAVMDNNSYIKKNLLELGDNKQYYDIFIKSKAYRNPT